MAISDKNVIVYLKISKEMHKWLKVEAVLEDRSVSNLINVALKKYRNEKKEPANSDE